MGLLAPLFLVGMLAVAVPVLVHLTHRERREPVLFPSLMFLHRVPFRSRERQRIRHWWLFALRALAVLLLALAFARPVLRGPVLAGSGPRTAVIVLDRSASMGAAGRWARAAAAAREALDALPGGSRAGLFAAADHVEVIAEPTEDRASVRAGLQPLRPSDGSANLPAAIRLAAERLAQAGGGELVLISDFQRAGFDRAETAVIPEGVTLRTVDVGEGAQPNVGLAGLSVETAPDADDRVIVTGRLLATATGGPRRVAARLEIEGRLAAVETVTVAPGAAATVRFPSLRRPERPRAARLVIPGDGYGADDQHHFVFAAPPVLGVLLLSRGDAPGGDGFYLRHALAVADQPRFVLATRPVSAIRDADLGSARVAVLHDAPFPAGAAGERLLEWVARGNGLFIGLGARGTLTGALRDSLGTPGEVVDRGTLGTSIVVDDASHPLFSSWGGTPHDALAGARTWRYRRLLARAGTIARFDDGSAALAETRYGRGRIVVWTVDLANDWSDLPVQPAFVPLVLSAVRYLAAFEPQPPAWEVGATAELHALAGSAGPFVVERPGGSRQALADASRLPLTDAGTWTVRRQGSREPLLLVAANTPVSESDPARIEPAAAVRSGGPATTAAADPALLAGERDRSQRLWWFALATVLALVATESVVASRLRGYA